MIRPMTTPADPDDTGVTALPTASELADAVARQANTVAERDKATAVVSAVDAHDRRVGRVRVAAIAVDVVLILCVSTLIALGRIPSEIGVPILVAVAAGRLRPAMGSGALAWVPFAGWALDRWAARG